MDIDVNKQKMHACAQGDVNIQTLAEVLKELRAKRLFYQYDTWKIMWDIMISVMVLYSVMAIPYRVGFRVQNPIGGAWFISDMILDCTFFIDLLLRCNTAIVDDFTEQLVLDRRRIIREYASFWLWVDLVSCIPFDLIATVAGGVTGAYATLKLVRVLRLTRLFKIVRMLKLKRLRKLIEAFTEWSPGLVSMMSLTFQLTFIAHFIACFWFYLSTEDVTGVEPPGIEYADTPWYELPDQRQVTWVTVGNLQHATELDQYCASFYWVVTTMLSVGYGEISGTNDTERIYCIFTMLFGGVVFGAVIAQVTSMIENQNPQLTAYKAKMDEVKAYLSEKRPPPHLRQKALDAYSYYLKRKSSFGERAILDGLPEELKTKLVYELYFREIKGIDLFSEAKTYDEKLFVVRVVQHMKPQRASKGETIFRAGDIAKHIVFVMSGIIRISTLVDDTQEVVVGYCSKGGFFGDIEYHKKTLRLADYKAALNCSLLSVPARVFDEACAEYPEAGAKFRKLLDYRNDNFQKASKLPPIRSPTKVSSSPRLMGSSLTAKISSCLAWTLRPITPCLKVFETDPHTSTSSLGGTISHSNTSKRRSEVKSLPSRLQLWVDGELRLPVTLGDEFKITTDEEMLTYRVMYLDTSSISFDEDSIGVDMESMSGRARRKSTINFSTKQSTPQTRHDRTGESGWEKSSEGRPASSTSGKRHHKSHGETRPGQEHAAHSVLMSVLTSIESLLTPIRKRATSLTRTLSQSGKKMGHRTRREGDSDSDSGKSEDSSTLRRQLSKKVHEEKREKFGMSEEEIQAARKHTEDLKQGGTVVYAEAGMEFFAFYNLLHPDGKRKNIWSIFISMLVIYTLITVPIQVGFNAHDSVNSGLRAWEWVVDFLLCVTLLCALTQAFTAFTMMHTSL